MKRLLLLTLIMMMVCCSAMAESVVLKVGFYVVGQEIDAGGYDVIAGGFGAYGKGICSVYADRSKMEEYESHFSKDVYLNSEPFHINLNDGEILSIHNLPLRLSNSGFLEEDYLTYTAPEGTLVAAGIYRVGTDIPAGTYRVYPSEIALNQVMGYRTEEEYQDDRDSLTHSDCAFEFNYFPASPEKVVVIEIEDGNVLIFDGSAILRKQEKIVFE